MQADAYVPKQYGKTGGLMEFDLRGLAASHDKSAIPNRDPTHASGGKRKREDEARAQCSFNSSIVLLRCT
jgi:hypothetical protein